MKFGQLYFIGGLTCIDFSNTFDHLHNPPEFDFFTEPAIILDWGKAAGILPPGFIKTLTAGKKSISDLLEARSLIFRLLMPLSRLEPPAPKDLACLNTKLQKVTARINLISTHRRYALVYPADNPLDRITSHVVRSMADLLLSDRYEHVRQCSECGWLFYDESRNHLRRWCSMKICGNRAKARRHYERVRQNRVNAA